MKYLYTKDQYKRIVEADSYGPMANDINWGDSLLGRMVYAIFRSSKINLKSMKIDGLLKQFRQSLDLLVAESLSRDDRSKLIILTLKSYFNDLNNICLSSKDEKEKLKELLGTSDPGELWNPENPNRGNWIKAVNLSSFKNGLLVKIHEFIKLKIEDKHANVAGFNKVTLLSNVSYLIDELREYSYLYQQNPTSPSPTSPSPTSNKKQFPVKFNNLIKKYASIFDSFIIKNYNQFIIENLSNEDKDQVIALLTNIRSLLSNFKIIDPVKQKIYNTILKDKNKLVQEKNVHKQQKLEHNFTDEEIANIAGSIINLYNLYKKIGIEKLTNNEKSFIDTLKKSLDNDFILFKDKVISHLFNIMDHDYKIANNNNNNNNNNNTTNKINNDQEEIDKEKVDSQKDSQENSDKNELKKVINKLKNISTDEDIEKELNNISLEIKKKILLKIIANTKDDSDKKEAEELLKELEEDLSQKNEKINFKTSLIKENSSNSVLKIWNNWLKKSKIEENNLNTISQSEIDTFNSMLDETSGEYQFQFNPKVTPDPIIQIVRIFKRAHDLYFTEVIPSVRTSGAVSNITRRKYEYLGSGDSSRVDSSSGPWAVKSIRNKWVDGVMEILEDQQYRKIFANVDFVVAGSEDKFGSLVIENTKEDDSKGSHGNILFNFIMDLTTKETAANFDKQRNILLKKYFGTSIGQLSEISSGGSGVKNKVKKEETPQPKKEVKYEIFWEKVSDIINEIDLANSIGKPFIQLIFTDTNSNLIKNIKFHILSKETFESNGINHIYYEVLFFENEEDILKIHKIDSNSGYKINKGNPGFIKRKPGRLTIIDDNNKGVEINKKLNGKKAFVFYPESSDKIQNKSFTIEGGNNSDGFTSVMYKKDIEKNSITQLLLGKDIYDSNYLNESKDKLNQEIKNKLTTK